MISAMGNLLHVSSKGITKAVLHLPLDHVIHLDYVVALRGTTNVVQQGKHGELT